MPTMLLQRQKASGKSTEGHAGRLFTLSYRQWRQARGNALLANNFWNHNPIGLSKTVEVPGANKHCLVCCCFATIARD